MRKATPKSKLKKKNLKPLTNTSNQNMSRGSKQSHPFVSGEQNNEVLPSSYRQLARRILLRAFSQIKKANIANGAYVITDTWQSQESGKKATATCFSAPMSEAEGGSGPILIPIKSPPAKFPTDTSTFCLG
jgi:hypothetical protein